MRDLLDQVAERVKRGAYNSFDEASGEWALIKKTHIGLLGEAAALVDKYETEFPNELEGLKARLNLVADAEELRSVIKEASKKLPVSEPGITHLWTPDAPRKRSIIAGIQPDAEASYQEWAIRTELQSLIGPLLTAALTTIAGILALYTYNPIWGATSTDYMTLLVWALGVNLVASKDVDFKVILTPPPAGTKSDA